MRKSLFEFFVSFVFSLSVTMVSSQDYFSFKNKMRFLEVGLCLSPYLLNRDPQGRLLSKAKRMVEELNPIKIISQLQISVFSVYRYPLAKAL